MTSTAPFPRRRYREARRDFLRGNWRLLTIAVLPFIAVMIGTTLTMRGYLLGFVHATAIAGYFLMVLFVFHAATGSILHLAGAWGEDNTRDVLKSAKRRRLIWGAVHGIEVASGDIDHLVVMRDGRLVAIDSKWHTTDPTPQVLRRDAAKAASSARRASLVLRSLGLPRDVEPLIVLWGNRGPSDVPENASIDGVQFVAGRRLLTWLRRDDNARVRRQDARALLKQLEGFRERVRPTRSS
jgi:hypothetical protein